MKEAETTEICDLTVLSQHFSGTPYGIIYYRDNILNENYLVMLPKETKKTVRKQDVIDFDIIYYLKQNKNLIYHTAGLAIISQVRKPMTVVSTFYNL